MPRKPVVSRTIPVIDVTVTGMDLESEKVVEKTVRLPDHKQSEVTIINKVDRMLPNIKVVKITKIDAKSINYSMPIEQYIAIAKEL